MRRADMGLAATIVIVSSVILVHIAPAWADLAQPSAKAAVSVGDIALVNGPTTSGQSSGPWTQILSTTIKTASGKDLVMGVSLECGLYTGTKTSSKNGATDTSSASATIEVRVLIDGVPAAPGNVVFASRAQTLSATLNGLISGALTVDPTTGTVLIDQSLLLPEQIELITQTMNADHFAFAAPVPVGTHTVAVQARVNLAASFQTGSASAQASIGKGSLTVESVRLVQKGAGMEF